MLVPALAALARQKIQIIHAGIAHPFAEHAPITHAQRFHPLIPLLTHRRGTFNHWQGVAVISRTVEIDRNDQITVGRHYRNDR
jgi:hypothetical protein